MTTPKYVAVKHMSHNGPWLLIKTPREVRERRADIKANKPKNEIATRLRLLQIVKIPLPPSLQKASAAYEKADAVWKEIDTVQEKAYTTWRGSAKAWRETDAAWRLVKANSVKAYADRVKAGKSWQKAIKTKAGVAFHKQVCSCRWTPEQPDILKAK